MVTNYTYTLQITQYTTLHEKRRILRYSHVYTGVNKTHIATVF